MIRLFYAELCPFAQRPRAVLHRFGEEVDAVAVDLESRPAELLELSPTGYVPLLLDGDLKLYESDVINDYLVWKLEWEGALSPNPARRARERLAMKQWDQMVVPMFYDSLRDGSESDERQLTSLGRELDELWHTIEAQGGGIETMLGFHCGPFWVRFQWMREYTTDLLRVFEERESLHAWLDRTAVMPSIVATNPDRDWAVPQYVERFVHRD